MKKKCILIVSLKVPIFSRNTKDKFFFDFIKELKKIGFDIDSYPVISKNNFKFTIKKAEKLGIRILDKLEKGLIKDKYDFVLFTSPEIAEIYYSQIKSITDGDFILLDIPVKKKIENRYDYIINSEKLEHFVKVFNHNNKKHKSDKLVSIIILTFNQLKLTKKCYESLIKNTFVPYEIIFVDNGSTDGTIRWLKNLERENKNVKIFLNGKNLGFSKANNIGIRNSKGDYIVLLNNDVILTKGWLKGLVRCAESSDEIGLVGPCTNEAAGVQKVHAKYKLSQLHLFAYAWKMKNLGIWKEVHRLNAFCLLIKRDVIEKVGLLDEDFGPGGYEDYDYCLRVRHAGFKIYLAKDIYVHHIGGQGYWPNRLDYNKLRANNINLFVNKWIKKYLEILENLPNGL